MIPGFNLLEPAMVTLKNEDGTESHYTLAGWRHEQIMNELSAIRQLLEEQQPKGSDNGK